MAHKGALVADPLQKLALRFQEWREEHAPRARLPEQLWSAAVEVAGQQGVYRTARTLRLDYASLKKKVRARPRAAATTATLPAAFVELVAPGSLATDCRIELEAARGGRMRMEMKMTAAEAASLLRAWRDGEA